MNVTITPGTPVNLFTLPGITAGDVLGVTILSGTRVTFGSDNTFSNTSTLETADNTLYTADGLSELWVKASTTTVISVTSPLLMSPWDVFSKAFTGTRALTVQHYPETNVKRGIQFYFRTAWPLTDLIGAGASKYLYFETGAKWVLTKLRIFHYIGEEFQIQLSAGPTLTAATGTPVVPVNYNLNPLIAQATTVTGLKDPTVTDEGAVLGEPEYFFGTSGTGQRVADSIPEDRELVVPPNSSFLVKITNTGNNAGRAQYFLDWAEVTPDLPLIKP